MPQLTASSVFFTDLCPISVSHQLSFFYHENRELRVLQSSLSVRSFVRLSVARGLCRQRGDGAFGHPTECGSYVICLSTGVFIDRCPDGLVFNEMIRACDLDIDDLCQSSKSSQG